MAGTKRIAKIPQEINVTHPTNGSSLELVMRTQALQNDKLDKVAAELLRTAALADDEVERIVLRDELFSSVRTRIIADSVTRVESTNTITFFQRTAILTAAAAIIVVAVMGTMMLAKKPNDRSVAKAPSSPPVFRDNGIQAEHMDVVLPDQKPEEVELRPAAPHYVKAVEYHPVVQERRVDRPLPRQEEQPPQFFALAGLRPSEVAVDGSRIIRVELPRASLVTLGVNVPLDSDKQLIKTDLLVGPDGVPRAIRLVD
jgi:hypothetical protein